MTTTDMRPQRASKRIGGTWVAVPLIVVGLWLAWSSVRFWEACWDGSSIACQDVALYGDLSWMYLQVWGALMLCLVGAVLTRPWRWFLAAMPVLVIANVVDVFAHWGADITEWYGILTGVSIALVGAALLALPRLSQRRAAPHVLTVAPV